MKGCSLGHILVVPLILWLRGIEDLTPALVAHLASSLGRSPLLALRPGFRTSGAWASLFSIRERLFHEVPDAHVRSQEGCKQASKQFCQRETMLQVLPHRPVLGSIHGSGCILAQEGPSYATELHTWPQILPSDTSAHSAMKTQLRNAVAAEVRPRT